MTALLAEQVEGLIAPIAERNGYELVAVETAGGDGQPIIRVFLDSDGGITLDAICEANRWISDGLEDLETLSGSYTLEVSSPGIERPLGKLSDFEKYTGEKAKLKTAPVQGRSAFTGVIEGVEGEDVLLGVDGQTVHVPFGSVKKARLKPDMDFGG